MFVGGHDDPTVPRGGAGLFGCLFTQTCVGPDGAVAEPGNCDQAGRACYGKGRVG